MTHWQIRIDGPSIEPCLALAMGDYPPGFCADTIKEFLVDTKTQTPRAMLERAEHLYRQSALCDSPETLGDSLELQHEAKKLVVCAALFWMNSYVIICGCQSCREWKEILDALQAALRLQKVPA